MRKFLSTIWFLTFLIATAIFIFGLMATKISPAKFWPLTYFGLAFPFSLIIIFAFLCYWLFTKNKKLFFPVLLLIIGWNVISAFLGFSIFGNKSAADSLKIMTYNVRNFELYSSHEEPENKDDMLQLIRDQDADIICFQEFYDADTYTSVESISKELDMPYHYFEIGTVAKNDQHFGIAIYSKYPLTNKRKINLGESGNLAQQADVYINDDTLTVFNMHLASIRFEQNDYKYINDIKQEGTKATNTGQSKRIAQKVRDGSIKRSEQAEQVKGEIKASSHPKIVCGDFNDTPVSYAYQTIAKGLTDTFIEASWGLGHTYTGILPLFRIDHVLVSKDFNVQSHKIIHEKISDHYPVVTEVSLK